MGVDKPTDVCSIQMYRRMMRYMAGVRWQDGRSSSEVAEMCGVGDLFVKLRQRRLIMRWSENVRRAEGCVLGEVGEFIIKICVWLLKSFIDIILFKVTNIVLPFSVLSNSHSQFFYIHFELFNIWFPFKLELQLYHYMLIILFFFKKKKRTLLQFC